MLFFCYWRSIPQTAAETEQKRNLSGAKLIYFFFSPRNIYEQTVIEALMQKGDLW